LFLFFKKEILPCFAGGSGARFCRGRAETAGRLYDAAQADFDAIVAAHPEFVSPYVYRGITYLRQHKPPQAVIELNKAMSAETGIGSLLAGNVYIYRGLAFEELGHGSEAVADLTDAMKTINGDEHDWTVFGFGCYSAAVMGLIDTASMYCDESISRHSRNELAYNARGYLDIKSGKFSEAVTDFTKALYYQDDNTFDLFGRGAAKHALGDRAGGDVDIVAATSSEPHIAEIMTRVGISASTAAPSK
jgi:tetratricopeptide (TPR) repeat protein